MNKVISLRGCSSGTRRPGSTDALLLRRVLAGCGALALCGPQWAGALGVRNPNQDPAAIARGNAFAATADNPSAIYYNPAGITQLEGHNVQVGSLFYLNIYAEYQSPGGARTENEHEVTPIPQLHYVFSPKDSPFSFGLGVYAPFGLSMKWPNDAPFRNTGLEAKLTYITANPVAAVKLNRTLSLAIGPTFNYSDLDLRQGLGVRQGDDLQFKGDNIGYGFNVGLLWQPYEEWSFGLTYKSGVRVNYDGTTTIRLRPPAVADASHSSAPLDFPQIISGGVSFRPTKDWNIEADVDWTDWECVDQLALRGVPARKLDWHSSFFYEVGVTRQLTKGYFVSAGYFYSENSTSERNFIPTVPDADLHVASLGVGHRSRSWQWALAGQLIGGGWRTVSNSANPTANGRYRLFAPTISLSGGYHF